MRKLTEKEVIEEIKEKYNYDTSLVKYKSANDKICLICHHKDKNGIEHGEFYCTTGHLRAGHGCPKCGIESRTVKRKKGVDKFIEDAKKIHGDKYDYSKVEYVNGHTKVCIVCPKHGEFWQTPASHLSGKKCPKCSHHSYRYTNESFITEAREVHGDKYDYSKIEYINNHTKVCIICPKHGEFWQTPVEHLRGCGCKYCKESHLEGEIRVALKAYGIAFKYDVRDIEWLRPLTYDFFIPEYRIAIECQGEQHFRPVEYFGGIEKYNELVKRDEEKKKLSDENNVRLLYYSNYKYKKGIITDVNEIINEIRNDKKEITN